LCNASTSFSSCINIFKGSNEMMTSSTMVKLIQCQKRLKEINLIEILELKKGLIHFFGILC
jgi:hypothetical protein